MAYLLIELSYSKAYVVSHFKNLRKYSFHFSIAVSNCIFCRNQCVKWLQKHACVIRIHLCSFSAWMLATDFPIYFPHIIYSRRIAQLVGIFVNLSWTEGFGISRQVAQYELIFRTKSTKSERILFAQVLGHRAVMFVSPVLSELT